MGIDMTSKNPSRNVMIAATIVYNAIETERGMSKTEEDDENRKR